MKPRHFDPCLLILTLLLAMQAASYQLNAQSPGDLQTDPTVNPMPQDMTLLGSTTGTNPFNPKLVASKDNLEGQEPRPRAWLGVATEEAPEALSAQLRLGPGVGLVITYVATNSPAAKAGLARDDVLVAFESQSLVHPQQLRKLVQVRQDGDAVKLTYYRAGNRETATVTLAKAPKRSDWIENGNWLERQGYRLTDEVPWDEYQKDLQERVKLLQRSLGDMRINQKQVQDEVRRSMEQARRAAEDALRTASNELKNLGPSAKALQDMARGWIRVKKDATVTVNSSDDHVQTLVKTDDSGFYILVASPRKHLTVCDPAGKLVFDGEIETPAQQEAVPKAVWEKVRPLADKMQTAKSKSADLNSPEP